MYTFPGGCAMNGTKGQTYRQTNMDNPPYRVNGPVKKKLLLNFSCLVVVLTFKPKNKKITCLRTSLLSDLVIR